MTDRNAARPSPKRAGESALETAIRALRSGDVVCLTGSEGTALMLAADGLTEGALARLRTQSTAPLDFVLTAARARALGLDVGEGSSGGCFHRSS